jgi:hypothetical protein
VTTIPQRLQAVLEDIHSACDAAGRSPDEVKLVAVSKTHSVEAVVEAWQAGQRHFGENYAQELRDKGQHFQDHDREICWHYIGRLQRNKAKYIAPRAHRIHALESVDQAEALVAKASGPLKALLAVNTGGEESKGGVAPAQALERCKTLAQVDGLQVVGLMTLPPFREDPEDVAPFFQELADLAERGRAAGLPLHELSMGMSHDYAVAIRYGATWVRVGTAIFGPREG